MYKTRTLRIVFSSIVNALLLSAAVHAQSIDVDVAQSGTATFSYPIQVPPGIAGMTPRIALSYTSGGINGPVGVGWSIQGVSVIARCAATVATDGLKRGVQFLPSDKLCLDGQRLIQTDATGAASASQIDDARGVAAGSYREYRTEVDSFARIRAYGSAAGADTNGPAYFKAWTKAGEVYEYGNSSDSGLTTSTSNIVAAWSANKISDTVGNAIVMQYEQRTVAAGSGPSSATVGKELNLSSILYTSQGSQPAANKLTFTYVDRVDVSEAYHRAAKNVSVRLLDSIRTYTNVAASPVEVKAYKLTMGISTTTQRARLQQIVECAGSNESKCFPPTKFTNSEGGNEAYVQAPGFNLGGTRLFKQDGSYNIMLGDFDGDGKLDMIRWSNTPSENTLYFSRPTSSGGFGTPDTTSFVASSAFNITGQNLNHSNGCAFSIVADFNGDGRADILRWGSPDGYDINGNANCVAESSSIYLSKGDGSFTQIVIPSSLVLSRKLNKYISCDTQQYQQCATTGGSNFYIGDIDGDGRPDIIVSALPAQPKILKSQDPPSANKYACADYSGNPIECTFVYHNNGDGTFTKLSTNILSTSIYTDPSGPGSGYTRSILDLDGDGLGDVMHPQSSKRLLSQGNGNFNVVSAGIAFNTCTAVALDLNGDGKPDYLCPAGNVLTVGLGDGNFFQVSNFNLGQSGSEIFNVNANLQPTIGVVVADVNGDGRSDLIRWEDTQSSNALYLSNGNGTFRLSTTFNFSNIQLKSSAGTSDFVVGDFSGRGTTEILRLADDNTNMLYVKADATPPDLLLSVTTPLGSTSQIAYASISRGGSSYVSGRIIGDPIANSTYPKAILQFPAYVVSTLSRDGGSGATVDSHYQYQGLTASLDGRGLLGFGRMLEDFPGGSGVYLTKDTTYSLTFPYIGLPLQSSTRTGTVGGSGSSLSQSSTTYCDTKATSGCSSTSLVRQPYAQQIVESGSDLGGAGLPSVTTTNTFDGDGNATQITVQTSGSVGGIAQMFTKTAVNTYLPANKSGDAWILGRLQQAAVTDAVPDDVLAASAGTSANATKTQGSVPALGFTVSPSAIAKSQTTAGTMSATASVAVTNGTAPYTYNWAHTSGTVIAESGGSSATFSATLSSGQSLNESFTVTVTDAAGRVGSALLPVAFSVGAPLSVSLSPSTLSASRNNPGSISASTTVGASGGTAPYAYAWSRLTGSRIAESGGQSATFGASLGWNENLSESYRVTITDAANQTKTADLAITFTTPPTLQLVVNPASLNTAANNPGTASASTSLSASGGVGPYTYAWTRLSGSRISQSGTQSSSFSVSLGWGENLSESFRATLTDSVGNVTTQDIAVTFTTPPQLVASINPASLNTATRAGAGSASASVAASGGVGGLTYTWSRLSGSRIAVSGGQAASFSVSLGQGENLTESFRVTVSDQAGHTVTADISVTFTTPAALSVSISPTSITQAKSSKTSAAFSTTAAVSASGGTGNYSYNWQMNSGSDVQVSGGQTVTFSDVVDCNTTNTGTGTVTVTDTSSGLSGVATIAVSFRTNAPTGGCSQQ